METQLRKIFGYFVLGPHLILWIVDPILERIFRDYNARDYPVIGAVLLGVSIFGGLLLIYQKYHSKTTGVGWYAFAGITLLLNAIMVYLAFFFSPGF